MTSILLLSLLGSVISAIIGTFWYSPMTPMGRLHMKTIGFDTLSPEQQKETMENMKPKMWKYYIAQMILSFLMSFSVVYTVGESVRQGVPFKMAVMFPIVNWLCFMVPVVGSSILWGNVDRNIAWKKFFSDILSYLVMILVISFAVSLFV
jgi:Protein of unknown function (DUF1761)